MPGLSSVLDGWFGILFLIKDAAVLYEKHKRMYAEAFPIPAQNCTVRFRLSPKPVVGKSTLFHRQPELETSTETKRRMTSSTHTQNNLLRTRLSDRWIISPRTDVHVFRIGAIFRGLVTFVSWVFVMDPYGSNVMDALNEGC